MKQEIENTLNEAWAEGCNLFEYSSAANPRMPSIEIDVFPASLHQIDETKIIPLNLGDKLEVPYECTGPSLLANYIHINPGESITSKSNASSQVFYCIRGKGHTKTPDGIVTWKTGDYFATPGQLDLEHFADEDTAFYWVNDSPLLSYLGATQSEKKFRSVFFSAELLNTSLENVRKENEGKNKNRNGILLGNRDCPMTKTVTHTMWSLYNLLPRNTRQKAHRHNSIALDFCVSAGPNTYTLIGKRINAEGHIIDPIRADWKPGTVFVTPPGWWHSHHNESDEDAIVLPVQDAGLHTQVQTLDIQFSKGY